MPNHLQDLMNSARHATAGLPTYNTDGTLRHVMPTRAASTHRVSLRELEVPAFADNPLRTIRTALPTGTEAGQKTTLDHALIAGSRCVAAGSRIIVIPAAEEAQSINGEVVFQRRDIRFDLIEAADFTRVPEGDDLPVATLPIYSDPVDLDIMPLVGVHVALTRSEQRQYADGQLAASAMASIAMGVAKAADTVLLGTILDNNPTDFTLAKAATAGLRFQELRAMCGTAGTGAVVAANGGLVAVANMSTDTGGIAAELTDVMAETVIGDFSRSAVAVHEEIQLVADRTSTQGDLALTVFVGIQALLPRKDVFWKLGA